MIPFGNTASENVPGNAGTLPSSSQVSVQDTSEEGRCTGKVRRADNPFPGRLLRMRSPRCAGRCVWRWTGRVRGLPCRGCSDVSSRTKGSKTCSSLSSGMPGPLSRTSTLSQTPSPARKWTSVRRSEARCPQDSPHSSRNDGHPEPRRRPFLHEGLHSAPRPACFPSASSKRA